MGFFSSGSAPPPPPPPPVPRRRERQTIKETRTERTHKGEVFRMSSRYYFSTKRMARSWLSRTKNAKYYHYRIWKKKHHGYAVYLGPRKYSHGGTKYSQRSRY